MGIFRSRNDTGDYVPASEEKINGHPAGSEIHKTMQGASGLNPVTTPGKSSSKKRTQKQGMINSTQQNARVFQFSIVLSQTR
jgi:hypothetical protein